MLRATILLADNHSKFLETRARILEQAGYRVLCAGSPAESRACLQKGRVDVAILDLRLQDDEDDDDLSGLWLAREFSPQTPVIIMTHYPSLEKAVAALAAEPGGYPAAVRFIEKSPQDRSGPELMLQAVAEALQIGRKGFGLAVDEVTRGLNHDYEQARQDAKLQTWMAAIISVSGIIVILIGVAVAIWRPDIYPVGATAAAGGLITEAVNYLFLRRLDKAHARVDRFHHELYQIKLLQTLNAAADELVYEENREKHRAEILLQASRAWFSTDNRVHNSLPPTRERDQTQ